ncbi:MAG: lysophospholipid acyltransferase family protein [Elusimicrobiota bacterium]|nr:lysophospholipid acyltransferase family protein [Elusimicrobiota bacterium]
MLRALVPYLVYAFVTLVGRTTRLKVRNAAVPRGLHDQGRRFIYAFWHQRQVFFTWSHRGAEAAVLVSRSKDGDVIAETMRLSRIDAVRGSSSRGGAAAAREMMEVMKAGRDIGITPDGPKGPAREVKDGVIFLARSLGAPIVPITNSLSNRFQVEKAWDKFQVPLPFGRAVVVYGEPIEVGPDDDAKAKAAELKAELDRITAEADAEVAGGRA